MIPALEGVQLVSASCGQQHTCAIDAHGRCYSWGLGSFGQLGHGGFSDEPRPRKVLALDMAASPYISLHLPISPYISRDQVAARPRRHVARAVEALVAQLAW